MDANRAVPVAPHAVAGSVRSSATTAAPAAADVSAVAAVLAHTLLNSLSIVRGGAELLARHHDQMAAEERRAWYRRIDDHAAHLADVLERIAQGRLAEALAVSEEGVRRPVA